MKKSNLFLLVLALGVSSLFFTSCEEETKALPTVSIDVPNQTLSGDSLIIKDATDTVSVTYKINVTAEAEIETLKLDMGTGISSPVADAVGKADYTKEILIKVAPGKTVSIVADVTDKDGNTTSDKLIIAVMKKTVVGAAISSYTAKLLGGQDNAAGSSFASVNGSIYKTADYNSTVNPTLDITYGVVTNVSKVISANIRGTLGFTAITGATETKYISSTIDFATVSDDLSIKGIDFTSATTSIVVELNKVYAFKNASNKIGLFKVTALTTGNAGSITIDVKVQK